MASRAGKQPRPDACLHPTNPPVSRRNILNHPYMNPKQTSATNYKDVASICSSISTNMAVLQNALDRPEWLRQNPTPPQVNPQLLCPLYARLPSTPSAPLAK